MKKSKFSDSQIMEALKRVEAGLPVPDLCRKAPQRQLPSTANFMKLSTWKRHGNRPTSNEKVIEHGSVQTIAD